MITFGYRAGAVNGIIHGIYYVFLDGDKIVSTSKYPEVPRNPGTNEAYAKEIVLYANALNLPFFDCNQHWDYFTINGFSDRIVTDEDIAERISDWEKI